MTTDTLKGKFVYDYRNMMVIDTLPNGKRVKMAYDAAGMRYKYLIDSAGTILNGSRVYVRGTGGMILAEFTRSGGAWKIDHYNVHGNSLIGKVVPGASQSSNTRYYYLTDHLGSIRAVVNENQVVDSWTDYYPFGKESRSSGNSANEQKEHFTGKERDPEIGLDYFGARYYNSEIGRWTTNDPMAHKYPSPSPYQYVLNNPVILIDPDGMEVASGNLSDDQQKTLVQRLSKLTGLNLSFTTVKNADGSSKTVLKNNGEIKGAKFSSAARADLTKAIDDKNMVTLYASNDNDDVGLGKYREVNGKERIVIDFDDFDKIDYDGMSRDALNEGTTVMHELQHSSIFGYQQDPPKNDIGAIGQVEKRINEYRSELGLPTRSAYHGHVKRIDNKIVPGYGYVRFYDKDKKVQYEVTIPISK